MKNEKGFTLVEILASITILFIVLTTFFAFFTQSAMFTRKNEESLNATNLANRVMEVLRSAEIKDIENLSDDLVEEMGLSREIASTSYYGFEEYRDFLLTIKRIESEEKLWLTKVKIEIKHEGRGTVLATRYLFVNESGENDETS